MNQEQLNAVRRVAHYYATFYDTDYTTFMQYLRDARVDEVDFVLALRQAEEYLNRAQDDSMKAILAGFVASVSPDDVERQSLQLFVGLGIEILRNHPHDVRAKRNTLGYSLMMIDEGLEGIRSDMVELTMRLN